MGLASQAAALLRRPIKGSPSPPIRSVTASPLSPTSSVSHNMHFSARLLSLLAAALLATAAPHQGDAAVTVTVTVFDYSPSSTMFSSSQSTPPPTPTFSPSSSSSTTWAPSSSDTPSSTPPPSPPSAPSPSSAGGQCNTGPIQCCSNLVAPSDPRASSLLDLVGLVVHDIIDNVGLGCEGLVGGGSSCISTPVCCENNSFNGLINIGCVPIVISL
ncbi:uncharacterized protein FIBRA_06055 [Fibroporia radiculosa]|uniref:Hydrophobin n=1 Tax=Fibroporia radiculosa TaxID=599839 RepID=J4H3V5_9APHY|nr:uncharacterized protein FIBRA_06055 [Fibroporia radiculosa]CCM03904.1 predicted protein [Fibroporia radiculosa]